MSTPFSIFYLFAIPFFFSSCGDVVKKTKGLQEDVIKKAQAVPKIDVNGDLLTSSTVSTFLYGIDISKFQGNEVEMLNSTKDSLTFVICKATEGITYTDPDFAANWKNIAAKGFIRGAYHFYHCNDAPATQAANFLAHIMPLRAIDLPPIVDFENGGIPSGSAIDEVQKNLLSFLKLIEEKTNRKPMIYTNINVGNKYLNNSAFADYALWVADYNGQAEPQVPIAWQDQSWAFWQKSSSYSIGKIKNDFDLFNGSRADLKKFNKNN